MVLRSLLCGFLFLCSPLLATDIEWKSDYNEARKYAAEANRDVTLLIHFGEKDVSLPHFEELAKRPDFEQALGKYYLLNLSLDYKLKEDAEKPLRELSFFDGLKTKSGLVKIPFHAEAGKENSNGRPQFLSESDYSTESVAQFIGMWTLTPSQAHLDFVKEWPDGQYAEGSKLAIERQRHLVLVLSKENTNPYEQEEYNYIKEIFENYEEIVIYISGPEAEFLLKDKRFELMLDRGGIIVVNFRNYEHARLNKELYSMPVRILPEEYLQRQDARRLVEILGAIPDELSLTQSMMTFAVREHPVAHSADGTPDLALMEGARQNSKVACEKYKQLYLSYGQAYAEQNFGGGHHGFAPTKRSEISNWAWSLRKKPENRCLVAAAMDAIRVHEWFYNGQLRGHWGAAVKRWGYFGWDIQYVDLPRYNDGKWFSTGCFGRYSGRYGLTFGSASAS